MAKESKLPVFSRGQVKHFAFIDAEDCDKLGSFKWHLDEKQGAAYRNIKTQNRLNRLYLHREVMKCKTGDGYMITAKDNNKLNCRKNNLEFGEVRKTSKFTPSKFFPRKLANLLSYVNTHHPKTSVENFLSIAAVDKYSTKEVVFSIEEDNDTAALNILKMQDQLQLYFEEQFGFRGKMGVVRRKALAEELHEVRQTVNVPATYLVASAAAPTATSKPKTDAMAMLNNLGAMFGVGKETAFEFINFGIKHEDEIHTFSYERKKIEKGEKVL